MVNILFLFRYSKFIDMQCTGVISPEKLPPTARTAYFHGLRVYYQIMVWFYLKNDLSLEPTDWGWEKHDHILVPTLTDMEVAPQELKQIIRCKCNTITKNPCGTKLCTQETLSSMPFLLYRMSW